LIAALNATELQELSDEFMKPGGWWRDWTWLVLTAVAVTAFALDVAGGRGSGWHRFEDGLHLFPSGFPGRPAPGTSDLTQAAQLLAPLVGLFLSVRLVAAVFGKKATRLRARMRRSQVVICGLDEKGFRAAQGFLDAKHKVTCVAAHPPEDLAGHLRARGAIVLDEDATQMTGLRAAGVQRASHVVCSGGFDRDNAQTAAMVAQISLQSKRNKPLFLFVHIGDPELAHLMRSAAMRLGPIRIQFFDINAVWARALVRAGPLGNGSATSVSAPQLVVVGTTDLARALVVRAARRWHFNPSPTSERLRLTLVDANAEEACAQIVSRYPALRKRTDLIARSQAVDTHLPGDLRSLFEGPVTDGDALYPCLEDEGENLGLAMQARRQFGPAAGRILIPATAWTFRLQRLLLDSASGITPVFYSPRPDSLDLLQDSALEAIARSVHQAYLDDRELVGDFGSRPADVSWSRLNEVFREATRSSVDEMVLQTEALWYEVEPLYDWDEPPVEFSPEQIELLAQLEHERWCRDRLAAGWEYGPVRDDIRKLQPLLVGWQNLDEEARDIDRALVRSRPAILARAGYRLVRSAGRETVARDLHARHLDARASAGEPLGANPSLVPWDGLTEGQRELTRLAVDDIPVKLLRLGYRMVRGKSGGPLVLNTAEIDELAREEHDRWCSVRHARGWQHGDRRDDDRKRHPDLLPWAELPDARRQIDRDQVLAIPGLLQEGGYSVVRLLEFPEPAPPDGRTVTVPPGV
jgi:hypothetical protein